MKISLILSLCFFMNATISNADIFDTIDSNVNKAQQTVQKKTDTVKNANNKAINAKKQAINTKQNAINAKNNFKSNAKQKAKRSIASKLDSFGF